MRGSDTNADPYYCSQQIKVPPKLPDVAKQFTKAAIRTQPPDVLAWSAAYFRALANGEVPPVKEHVELPVATQKTDTGFTVGLLKVLHKQLGPKRTVNLDVIEKKWCDLNLPIERFHELVRLGSYAGEVEWIRFAALAAGSLASNLGETLKILCEILTADPEGGASRISFELFKELYTYLATIDGRITSEHQHKVLDHLKVDAAKQEGAVMPRNFLHPSCPPLQ